MIRYISIAVLAALAASEPLLSEEFKQKIQTDLWTPKVEGNPLSELSQD